MIELILRLTDEQLSEIAQCAAALVPTDTAAEISPWLNVAEAAGRLRCSKDRIYNLIALGKLQPRRDGRRVLLHRDELDAYVEGQVGTRDGCNHRDAVASRAVTPGAQAKLPAPCLASSSENSPGPSIPRRKRQ